VRVVVDLARVVVDLARVVGDLARVVVDLARVVVDLAQVLVPQRAWVAALAVVAANLWRAVVWARAARRTAGPADEKPRRHWVCFARELQKWEHPTLCLRPWEPPRMPCDPSRMPWGSRCPAVP
jgi:hypothetical protein